MGAAQGCLGLLEAPSRSGFGIEVVKATAPGLSGRAAALGHPAEILL